MSYMSVIIMHKHKLRLSANDCYANYIKNLFFVKEIIVFVKSL